MHKYNNITYSISFAVYSLNFMLRLAVTRVGLSTDNDAQVVETHSPLICSWRYQTQTRPNVEHRPCVAARSVPILLTTAAAAAAATGLLAGDWSTWSCNRAASDARLGLGTDKCLRACSTTPAGY